MYRPTQAPKLPNALYQRYAPAVLAYLMRQVHSREDAEDLLLEIFLVILEKEPMLERDERFQHSYIWAIARHKVADYYRHSAKHPSISLATVEEMIYERDDREPEQVALRREEYAQLHRLMKELPEMQREVLQLRFGHGLSYEEIAQVLAKSEGAVRMILHRALKLLRGAYNRKLAERSK